MYQAHALIKLQEFQQRGWRSEVKLNLLDYLTVPFAEISGQNIYFLKPLNPLSAFIEAKVALDISCMSMPL